MTARVSVPEDRWAWVEVDLAALRRNAKAFRAQMRPGVRMMAVIKADGLRATVPWPAPSRFARLVADQFAVATVAEGVGASPRRGVSLPILVLSQPPMSCVGNARGIRSYALRLRGGLRARRWARLPRRQARSPSNHMVIDTGNETASSAFAAGDVVEMRRASRLPLAASSVRAPSRTFGHRPTSSPTGISRYSSIAFQEEVQGPSRRRASRRVSSTATTRRGTILQAMSVRFRHVPRGIGPLRLAIPPRPPCRASSSNPVMSVRALVTRAVYPEVGDGVGYGLTVARSQAQHPGRQRCPFGYADGLAAACCLQQHGRVGVDGMPAGQSGGRSLQGPVHVRRRCSTRRARIARCRPVAEGDRRHGDRPRR